MSVELRMQGIGNLCIQPIRSLASCSTAVWGAAQNLI
jgi:hypothetical protein